MKKSKFIRNFLIVFGVYFMLMVISKNNISSNINDITNSIGTNNHSISNSWNLTNVMSTITSNFISAVGPTVNLVSGVDLIPNSTNETDMKNNTKNLQKAIDEMSDSGGGTIYLPAGTFYFAQGGIAAHGGEDYAFRCRNNVHLKGVGTNENSSNVTILKPYYNNSKADGGMDMFYFNNYADTGYNDVGAVTTSTKRDVTYTDMNNKKVTLKNPTKSGYTFLGWTGSNGTTASKSVTIKSGTTGDLAYTANWKQNEVKLTKIAIKTKPSKLTYNGGETLDTTGLVLTATYSDGSTRNITSGFIATPTSFNAPGTKTITVSYGGKTTSYTVTVNSVNVNTTLTKITIKTKPTKLVYNVGETLDTTGLVLTATYSDGTVKDITSGYTVNPTTLNTAGAKTITVSYGGKTTTYTVTVNSVTLNKIAIKTKPTKLVYNVGDKVDTTGLVLTATYSDGTVKDISSDYTVNPTTLNTSGAKTITVSYGGKTTSYTVTVNEIKVEKIEIVKLPQQLEYYVGDNFKSDGLTISIYNSNGSVETITSGYQLSIAEGSKLSSPGTIKVSVSYKSKTATFNINVLNKNEDSIIMSSMPNKTNYLVGEKFDATGLELQLVNNNGVTPIKDVYTLSLADGSVLNKVGTHKVVVTYQTKKFEFNIVVKKVYKI